ncbi:MAG TPA: retron system putative HNH endonuclease [Candidatus Kapabacteria bacterium]|nr:retron system putative HNH endonuclease [Candidatus Kapabacteria bacterium]
MLKIDKAEEPQEFIDFKKTHPEQWKAIYHVPYLNKKLREYLLEHEQKINSSYCCVYCERKITLQASHIEHIKPRCFYKNDTFNYQNLTVSCQEEREVEIKGLKSKLKTCGHLKGDHFDEARFINPVLENPKDFFTYDITTGNIIPREGLSGREPEKVKYTVDLLNLNHAFLADTRTEIINKLLSIENREELLYILDNYDQFPGIVDFFRSEYLDIWSELHASIA